MKRRPSTRKGRQEQFRRSSTDFSLDSSNVFSSPELPERPTPSPRHHELHCNDTLDNVASGISKQLENVRTKAFPIVANEYVKNNPQAAEKEKDNAQESSKINLSKDEMSESDVSSKVEAAVPSVVKKTATKTEVGEKISKADGVGYDVAKTSKLSLFSDEVFESDMSAKNEVMSVERAQTKEDVQDVPKGSDNTFKNDTRTADEGKPSMATLFEDDLFKSNVLDKTNASQIANVPTDRASTENRPKRSLFADDLFKSNVESEVASHIKNVETDEQIQNVATEIAGSVSKYSEKTDAAEKLPNLSFFKDDDDYDDLFSSGTKTTETKTSQSATKPSSLNIKPEKQSSLFGSRQFDDDDDGDDLFRSASESKPVSKVVTGSLFEDDDGLFGSRKPAVKTDNFASPEFESDLFADDDSPDIFSSKKLPPKSNLLKKSLFDDDLEDEDDIFAESTSGSSVALPKPSGKCFDVLL